MEGTVLMKLPLLFTVAWAALWLVGSWWAADGLEKDIAGAARNLLAAQGREFEQVVPQVAGQTVLLKGVVRHPDDGARLTKLIHEQLRLPEALGAGKQVSPAQLVITSDLRTDLRPAGWGLLVANPQGVRLMGLAGSESESVRVASELAPLVSDLKVSNEVESDPEAALESDRPTKGLDQAAGFTRDALKSGLAAFARWGGDWTILDLGRPNEHLRKDLVEMGLPQRVWEEKAGPALQALQDQYATHLAVVREQQKRNAQAVGYVVLAVRADTILIKGELGDEPARVLVADKIKLAAGERRVIDELAFNPNRRPQSDAYKLTSSLPQLPRGNTAKMLAVGTLATGWKVLNLADIDVEDANTIMPGMLPADADRRLLIADVAGAAVWVNSILGRPEGDPVMKPPGHLFMAIAGTQVMLRGRVADEPTRTLVESAVRKRYPALEPDIVLRVDPACEVAPDYLQTLGLLPTAPGPDTSGLLAFAIVGDVWQTKPARASLLEPDTMARSGLIPEEFPINTVLPDVLDVAPTLKAHFKLHERTAPRGIPMQTIGPR